MSIKVENNTLVIQKVETPDYQPNLLDNQKRAYQKYLDEVVYSDIQYLCEKLSNIIPNKEISADVEIGELYSTRSFREIKGQGNKYYPVNVTFSIDGKPLPKIDVLHIPYMDEFCVLNVSGKRKVLVAEMRSKEDISMEKKKGNNILTVVLPNRQIKIISNSRGVTIDFGKKHSFDVIVQGFMNRDGIDEPITDIFKNALLVKGMLNREFLTKGTLEAMVEKIGILEAYQSEYYKLGRLRYVLNERLSIDIAIGEKLSRNIKLERTNEVLKRNTIITDQVLEKLKYNLVNHVNIKAIPAAVGMILREDVLINHIGKGTKLNKKLSELTHNEYEGEQYLPVDWEEPIIFEKETKLTQDILDIMYFADVRSISAANNKDEFPRIIHFEQEIVGNNHYRVREITDNLLVENPDQFVYVPNIKDLDNIKEIKEEEYFTAYDIISLVSLAARATTMPELNETMNRDGDFLKKILLFNDTFSEAFRKAIEPFIRKNKRNIITQFLKTEMNDNPFRGLTYDMIKIMQETTLLKPEESINPVALLSQVNRVVALLQSKNGATNSMRTIALPYYGRICPYETPAGKTIGLSNTMAIGCRVEDGTPYTPYYRVINSNGKKKLLISKEPVWLSPIDEQKYRIGDRLSIELDEDGFIKPDRIIAKIPAPPWSKEKITVDTINSTDLDFVNVLPEQHISPTAYMIPFAAADDGVRVSYGLSLIRQSIYVMHSEVPLVRTTMYEDMFNYSDLYCKKAKKDGMVVEIESDSIIVIYDGDIDETEIHVPETRVSSDCITNMNYKVKVGQRFKKGDILVDSTVSQDGIFSPGVNILAVHLPDDGYNYEDAVVLSDHCAAKFTSLTASTAKTEIKDMGAELLEHCSTNYYQYIPKNGVIGEIVRYKIDDRNRERRSTITSGHHSGILYDMSVSLADNGNRVVNAQMLSFCNLQPGDKMSGRHGDKGTTSIIKENDAMPQMANGMVVDATFNPCGTVSRMNIGKQEEGHLGFIAYMLGITAKSDPFNGASLQDIKDLMKFVWHLAHDKSIEETHARYGNKFPEELYECARKNYDVIKDWEGAFNPDGTAPVFNPETGTWFENPLVFGMPYYLKIVHEVEHKQHSRAGMLESKYSALTKQPPQGSSRGGGQSNGEMEYSAIAAHGATAVLEEMSNVKSDNVAARVNLAMDMLGRPPLYDESEYVPRTVDLLRYNLEALGLKLNISCLPSVDYEDVRHRVNYDPRAFIKRLNRGITATEGRAEKMIKVENELDEL